MLARTLWEGGITPHRADGGFIGVRYHDDGNLRTRYLNEVVVYYLQEVRHDVGTNTGDPYVEAIHYWIENVRQFLESCSREHLAEVERLNFPAVLLMHFGMSLLSCTNHH